MHVIICSQASIWGGLEAHAFGLAKHLLQAGHETAILCFDEQTFATYHRVVGNNLRLISLNQSRPARERSLLNWQTMLRKFSADACIYEKGTLWSGSLSFEIAARLTYRRFITIEQLEPMVLPDLPSRRYLGGRIPGVGLWRTKLQYSGWLRSLMPQRIVTVSHSVRRLLHSEYRFPLRKMVTVWNGANIERFQPDSALRAAARKSWGISPEALVFGSARRFVRDKGLDLAIEAFREFRLSSPEQDAYLVLVGDGPDRELLGKQASNSGVGDRIRFPGFSSEPWTVYAGFDSFIMPSRTEALSLALVEAMACGCLPIATNIGGSTEVIEDSSLGWIVPPEDPSALCRAMVEVSSLTEDTSKAMRERVRERVVENFNSPKQYEKILAILDGKI